MKILRILGTAASALLLLAAAVLLAVWVRPPALLRVAAGYSAKTICSNVFLARREPDEVLQTDVQAPGHPLLRLMRVQVDRERGVVRSGLLGFIGAGVAVARPDVGCAVLPDGKLPDEQAGAASTAIGAARPAPASTDLEENPAPAVQRIIATDALTGVGMRGVVVLHDGRLVAERYGRGFDATTPLVGWSMAKTVTAALVGLLVKDGRLALDRSAGWPAGDARAAITIADLMSMTSGLQFNEGYGAVSDATRMLYLETDMARFARDQPLVHAVGEVWSYSSGTAVIVSRIFQDAVGANAAAFARARLFEPLGMTSAVLESDEHGTLVGSSYLFATPRDWARFGQLLVQDGVWKGREILPRGYVSMMASPVAASGGRYGHGMLWRDVGNESAATERHGRSAGAGLPSDVFWLDGHDGQYVAVVPSHRLVMVRMGLTPDRAHYHPQALLRAVLDAAD